MIDQEHYDRIVYDIMCDIWDAYRASTKSKSAKPFNDVFDELYSKHRDEHFIHVIEHVGLALAPSINNAVSGPGGI